MFTFLRKLQAMLDKTLAFDFLAPLAIRLYLAPVFWMAGTNKLENIEGTAAWFANSLDIPFPLVSAYTAALTEFAGAILLIVGLGVRWICVPLMGVMMVAIITVHWDNGWLIIADSSQESAIRLNKLLSWLSEFYPSRYDYATELGKPVILNNGIEFAVTYLVMLLSLFFTGAGRYLSLDYYASKHFLGKSHYRDQV